MDGSYTGKIESLVKDNATDIICQSAPCPNTASDSLTRPLGLDPPFILYFPRICYRTFAQILGYAEPCSSGCIQTWERAFTFGKEGILWRTWTHHTPRRQRRQAEMMSGEFRAKTRRLGGWGRELERWVKDIQEMVRTV